MIIAAKHVRLSELTSRILADPLGHGVDREPDGSVRPEALLEALLVFTEWNWLSLDDVIWLGPTLGERAFDGNHFRTVDENQLPVHERQSLVTPIALYIPSPVTQSASTTVTKAYRDPRTALLIAAHRQETFENASIVRLEIISRDVADSVVLTALDHGIVLVSDATAALETRIDDAESQHLVREVVFQCRFKEVLYRSDVFHQRAAAISLFGLRSQKDVEAALIPYLDEADADVRANVASALGVRGYGVKFVPGRPLPPREARLEDVSVEPDTLKALLARLGREESVAVVDAIVCTLTIQNYTGKLHRMVPDVRAAVTHLVEGSTSETLTHDGRIVLALLD